ncbi:MAG: hypothetical protein IH905_08920 [Proteobacteria bacterium]|nr:hypothetical protein [Pseudomonadota bacterium]
MTSKFKVAAAHASSVFLDQRGSIEKACGLIEAAGRQDVKILVFSESFVPGFPYWIMCGRLPFGKNCLRDANWSGAVMCSAC